MAMSDLAATAAASQEPSHQEKLALLLIQNLGYEGAVHACRANLWDGVLTFVLARSRSEAPDADRGPEI